MKRTPAQRVAGDVDRLTQRTHGGQVERLRTQDGTDVTIDHRTKKISGRVAQTRPGACPHRLRVVVDGAEAYTACIGEAGHITPSSPRPIHVDGEGRQWT